MKKRILSLMLSTAMVMSIALPTTAMAAPKPAKVQFTQKTYYVPVGKKYQLGKKLIVTPGNFKKGKFKWKSSKRKIATVSNKGLIKATKKVGKTKITVKSYNGKKAVCTVFVVKPVKRITLNHSSLTLNAGGGSSKLSFSVAPKSATVKKVTWTSSNPKVAQVASNGSVTPIAAGHAVITATSVQGGKQASCNVTVKNAPSSNNNASGGHTGTNTGGNTSSGGTGSKPSTGGTDVGTGSDHNGSESNHNGGNTSTGGTGTTTQPTTPVAQTARAELKFSYNSPANSQVINDEGAAAAEFGFSILPFSAYVTTSKTFTIPEVSANEAQYTFEGWTRERHSELSATDTLPSGVYHAGDQITVNKGDTVTLYALWRKKTMKKVEVHLMRGTPKGVDLAKTSKYFSADGKKTYNYCTVDGEDYIISTSDPEFYHNVTGTLFYSKISGLEAQYIADQIHVKLGLSQVQHEDIYYRLEATVQNKVLKLRATTPVVSTDPMYQSATAFVKDQLSSIRSDQTLTSGSTITGAQMTQCLLIWAEEMDQWCEMNTDIDGWHKGAWDYFLWGDTHFKYCYTGDVRGGAATGARYSSSGQSALAIINGITEVYTVE